MHISQYFTTFVPEKSVFMRSHPPDKTKTNKEKRMKIKSLIILVCMSWIGINAIAQEQKNNMPDLYTAEQSFFDPTLKTKEKVEYKFSAPWRIEAGYAQLSHRTLDTTAVYLHGLRLGATVDMQLPYNFSIQTGALLTLAYGRKNQHWGPANLEDAQAINILQHNIVQLQLNIPVRAYYSIKVWKKMNLFFYAGPQLNFGLTNYDILNAQVAPSTLQWLEQEGISTHPHDRYTSKELYRTNIQMGLGCGLEWDRWRVQAGYDFGLNNLQRTSIVGKQKLHEWGWMVTCSYKL